MQKKGIELLKTPQVKRQWKMKKEQLLKDKIDFTRFLIGFIEHWPESKWIMQENPGYQKTVCADV